jgi:serine/threonine protein kinase
MGTTEPFSHICSSGDVFGKYTLLRMLAVGGMAEVHLARLTTVAGFNKPVVLKVMSPSLAQDSNFVELFLDEARLAAQLNHPNIAQTFELGEVDGRYYIAMEYVGGESVLAILRRSAQRRRLVPLPCTIRVMLELLEALDYAHALTDAEGQPLNIIHRDVTPSNVMVTFHGGVKLVDFGIASAATQQHETTVGILRGKQGYMAPEQCRPAVRIDRRVDIFAAGCVLYTLATLREPFPDVARLASIDEFLRQAQEAKCPTPRSVQSGIPEELERIILKAMSRQRESRYQSALEMATDLEQFATAQRIFPSARHLSGLIRTLFPETAPLAHALERQSAEAVEKIAESFAAMDRVTPGIDVRAEGHEGASSESTIDDDDDLPWGTAAAVFPLESTMGEGPTTIGLPYKTLAAVQDFLARPNVSIIIVAAAWFIVGILLLTLLPSSDDDTLPAGPTTSIEEGSFRPGILVIKGAGETTVLEGSVVLGTTPLRVELSPGAHVLVLRNKALKQERRVAVSIEAGVETLLKDERRP